MSKSDNEMSSRDIDLHPLTASEERRQTGRYVAGGTALAITLLMLHHVLLRDASAIAGICVPAIIMTIYILWVLYSAKKDKRKALRRALVIKLADVISDPTRSEHIQNNVIYNLSEKESQDIT